MNVRDYLFSFIERMCKCQKKSQLEQQLSILERCVRVEKWSLLNEVIHCNPSEWTLGTWPQTYARQLSLSAKGNYTHIDCMQHWNQLSHMLRGPCKCNDRLKWTRKKRALHHTGTHWPYLVWIWYDFRCTAIYNIILDAYRIACPRVSRVWCFFFLSLIFTRALHLNYFICISFAIHPAYKAVGRVCVSVSCMHSANKMTLQC